MATATNIDATAVNTIAWLSASETTIVVPVYQRQYRWDIGAMRAAPRRHPRGRRLRRPAHAFHRLGPVVARAWTATSAELVLIDGQQRITTLMLLIAALHHTVKSDRPRSRGRARAGARARDPTDRAPSCGRIAPGRRSSRASCSTGARPTASCASPASTTTTRSSAARSAPRRRRASGAGCRSWSTSRSRSAWDANAQQIFESLNSTGEPLRDHELIHNYVLMGLSHAEQSEIEDSFWVPIEQNTGESIGSFWRHYLVMTTGREVAVAGERGVYDAFRHEFPRLDLETPASAMPRSGRRTRRSTACCWIPRTSRTPRSRGSSATSTPSGAACTRSSCAPTATTTRGVVDTAALIADARARAVAAAAPNRRRRDHRSARRPPVPRARRTDRTAWNARSAASRRRTNGCAWR